MKHIIQAILMVVSCGHTAISQNFYRTNPDATAYYASNDNAPIKVYRPSSASVDYYTFTRYDDGDGKCRISFVDIHFDDRQLSVTIDDFPAVTYKVVYLERSQGQSKVVKIITYAEPVKGERYPPKYTWYLIPNQDKMICTTTGITFHN